MFPRAGWFSGLLLLVAITASAWACTDEEAKLCEECDCCSSPEKLSDCANRLNKRDPFWKRGNDLDRRLAFWKRGDDSMYADEDGAMEDKRAKYFLGKRAKYFLGKRLPGDQQYLDDGLDTDEDKRAKYFLGKRAKYFLGKRAKYFLGKRDYGDDDMAGIIRRAKYFLGKRAKYFLGKRNPEQEDLTDLDKRAKYFLGKRYDSILDDAEGADGSVDKRQKYFLGKRSADEPKEASQ